MLIRLTFLSLLITCSLSASANKNACYTSVPISHTTELWGVKTTCKCGRALEKLELDTTGTLPLVTVCGYKQGNSEIDGFYFFKGDVSIRGTVIVVADNENPKNSITTFFGDKSAESLWSSVINNFVEFDHYGQYVSAEGLYPPDTSKRRPCWIAKATIRFWELRVLIDDTDAAGSIPVKFQVEKLGKYKACTAVDRDKFNI